MSPNAWPATALQQLAHTDSLTGLANRHTLRAALASALKKGRSWPAVLDLDHFKAVNDTPGPHGRRRGAAAVAARLRGCMRPGDLVARLGGDEFAVLMSHAVQDRTPAPGAAPDRCALSPSKWRSAAARGRQRGRRAGARRCGSSVDECWCAPTWRCTPPRTWAAAAMRCTRRQMGERSRRRLALEHGLRQAVEAGQLALHWQPKVDIDSWRIVGAEALLRWQHPELGAVTPGEFIVVAEQAGLIDEIGHWALRRPAAPPAGPLAGLVVSVNVSPLQLRDEHYVSWRVRDALRETRLDPTRLELEITESVFMGDAEGMLEKLHACAAWACASRWTTSAPAIRRWPTCGASRSTR
jgi:predicted signal transduction protein with EAL and GGDEF domain